MSTSAVSDLVEEPADADIIVRQINAAQGRIRSTDIMTATVTCGIFLTAYVLLFTVADHWLVPNGFSPWTRAALLAAVVVGVILLACRFLARPLSKTVTALYAAKTLDRESASGGALLSLVDLQQAGAGTAGRVHRTVEDRARIHLQATSLDDAVDRTLLIRMGIVLFGLILVTCLYSVLSPKPISLLRSLTLFSQDVATRTRITNVAPGDVSIPMGGQLEVTADISGVMPESVRLLYTTEDKRYVSESLAMEAVDENGRFTAVIAGDDLRGIRQPMDYQIQAGDALSQSFEISVDVPPQAEVIELRYRYPKYTSLPDTASYRPHTNIDAWEGTNVLVLAKTTVPVVESFVELCADRSFQTDVIRFPATIDSTDSTQLKAEFKLEDADAGRPVRFYRVTVRDDDNRRDPSPIVYSVNIQPDAPPVVTLEDPTADLNVPANTTVPLLIHASDPDFLLNSVTLQYEINGKPVETGERIYDYRDGYQKIWSGVYDFELASLGLEPGDVVRYWIQARDNRHPLGPASVTPSLKLQILKRAGQQQLADELQNAHERLERSLKRIQKEQQEADDDHGRAGDQQNPETVDASESQGDDTESPVDEIHSDDQINGDESADGTEPQDDQKTGSENSKSTPQDVNDVEHSDSDDLSSEQNNDGETGESQAAPRTPLDEEDAIQKIIDRYRNKPEDASDPDQQLSEQPQREPEPDGDKPDGDKPDGDKPHGDKPDGDKPHGDKPGGDEPHGDKPGGDKPGGDEPGGDEPGGDEPGGDEPGGDEPGGDEPGGDEPGGDEPGGDKPGGDKPGGDKPHGDKPGGDEPAGDEPGGDEPGGDEPGGDEPGGDKPGGDKPGGDKPGGDKPGGDKPGGDKPGGDEPGGDKPGGDKPGGDKPGGDEPGGDKPGGGKPGGDKPGGDKPGGDKPGGDKPGGDKPGGDEPGGDKPGGDKPGGDKPGGDKPGGDEPGGDKPGGGKPGGDKPGGGKPGGDKPGGDKPGGDKPGGDKPGGDKPGGDKPGGDKPGGDKPGGDEPGGDEPGGDEPGGDKPGGDKPGGDKPGGDKPGGDKPGGGKPGGGKPGGGAAGGGPSDGGKSNQTSGEDANLTDEARAANLALQRIERDLDRGQVDEELLKELGWTPERLREFAQHMHDQLKQLDSTEAASPAENLQRLRTRALLESLDLSSKSTSRQGTAEADRQTQNTATPRRPAPPHLRERVKNYQKRVLENAQRRR